MTTSTASLGRQPSAAATITEMAKLRNKDIERLVIPLRGTKLTWRKEETLEADDKQSNKQQLLCVTQWRLVYMRIPFDMLTVLVQALNNSTSRIGHLTWQGLFKNMHTYVCTIYMCVRYMHSPTHTPPTQLTRPPTHPTHWQSIVGLQQPYLEPAQHTQMSE